MLYIWPWQAPALPPLRLISSMITVAAVRPRPVPPYSWGSSRPSSRLRSARVDEGLRVAALRVDLAEVLVGNWRHSCRTASRMSGGRLLVVHRDSLFSQAALASIARCPPSGVTARFTVPGPRTAAADVERWMSKSGLTP